MLNGKNGQASPLASSSSVSLTSDASPSAVLRCAVENVYPKPDVMIYAIRRDGSRYAVTDSVIRREELSPVNRAHSVYLSAQIFDSEVNRKYLEDGYHTYSSSYNYHPSSPLSQSTVYSDQHPFHLSSTDQQFGQRVPIISSSSPSPPSSSPPSLSSGIAYQFECVSTIDVKLASGNLTKASALTYTPSSRDDSHFFNSKVSSFSSPAVHRPSSLLLSLCTGAVITLMRTIAL